MSEPATPGAFREMTFLEHFEELRRRIFRALVGLAVAFAVATAYMKPLMQFLTDPYFKYLPPGQRTLAFTEVTEVFFLYMKVALVGAVFLGAPWIFAQVWAFIAPGLRPQEKRWAVPFVLATSLFFMAGMAFCYYFVLPLTFRFFFEFNQGFQNVVTVTSFWSFEMKFLLGLGLVFETPVLIFLLTRLGLVTPKTLWKGFRWAVLTAFIVSAVITPSGDPLTQTVVAVPIIVLYALGVLVSYLFRKRDAGQEASQ